MKLILKITNFIFLATATVLVLASCSKSGGDAFSFVGESPEDPNESVGAVQITSAFPSTGTVVQCVSQLANPRCGSAGNLSSSSTQAYTVSVSGAAPIEYTWKLNGTVISGADSSIYNLTTHPTGLNAGLYTLEVTATNSFGSKSHSFSVKVNEPPRISATTPTDASAFGLNYSSTKSLIVNAVDSNGDAISYAWTLDSASVARLTGSDTGVGSQGDYSPVVGDLGSRTVKVVLTDSHAGEVGAGRYVPESAQWTVQVNYFSDVCNTLVAGSICTVVGSPGLMTDNLPAGAPDFLYDALLEPIKIRPNYIFNDGSGNLFISDSANHVIWFHNRSASTVSRLGRSVEPGKVLALFGTGSSGTSPDSDSAYTYNKYKLNAPQMMYYDTANDVLYVADHHNHRVVRLTNDGRGLTILGGPSITAHNTTTNGANATEIPATDAVCVRPVGLVVNAAKTRMYVACSGSHLIKYINMTDPDPTQWTSSIAVGRVSSAGAVTNGEDDNVIAGGGWNNTTARIQYPWALALDANENLYFTLNNQGRLQVLRIAATPTSYFAGLLSTPTVGRIYTVVGDNGDNSNSAVNVTRAGFRLRDTRGIAILEPSAGNITGFFLSNGLRSLVSFVNNSNSDVTFGGRLIESASPASNLSAGPVWGVYSALGGAYTGEGAPAAHSNRLSNPSGILLVGNDLIVADTNNFRVRKLDLSVGNGNTSVVTGGVRAKSGSSADSVTPAMHFQGLLLEQMIFDPAKNKLYFADNGTAPTAWNTSETPRTSDFDNHRIRRLDPLTGAVDTMVGRGWGDTSPLNEPANTALIQGVKGMALLPDGNLLFADRHLFGGGGNRSCMVRAYNTLTTDKTYFGATILAGNVGTVAGNYANGCNSFTGDGGPALNARMYYPEGIATDSTNLYIASYQQHCILKVDSGGTISSFIGSCGSQGDVNGGFGTARLRFPTQLMADPRHPTNFFVVDQTDQPASSIKYVNLSGADVDVVGSTVAHQRIEPLTSLTSGGYTQAMTAWVGATEADDLICYTSGALGNGGLGSHNVICRKRITGDLSIRIGQADGSLVKGGTQLDSEEEGEVWNAATKVLAVKLNGPAGLAFDSEGNLYITERDSSVIRKVKRWF